MAMSTPVSTVEEADIQLQSVDQSYLAVLKC